MGPRVLITDRPWPDSHIERSILEPLGCEVIEASDGEEATLLSLARHASAIAVCWAPMTGNVIAAAEQCRHIARTGIGLDNIDVAAATARGILVTNVPDYCVDEVADHALAMLLAMARNIPFFHSRTKSGEYDLRAAPPVTRLSEQTLGLIGFGRIARKLRSKASAVGLHVISHTPSGQDYGTGCEMVSRDELFSRSDYISLHAPLNDGTQHLIDATALATMKENAVLINTSRGGLIDHNALWDALERNRLRGAALDVFDPEPPDLSQPLFQDERVIVTPHAAFVSVQSLRELRERTARQIADLLAGRRPEHVVNPEVLDESA